MTADNGITRVKKLGIRIFESITAPSPNLEEVGQKRRARILSAFLFLASVLFLFIAGYRFRTSPGYISYLPQIAVNLIVTLIAYGISRTKFYVVAATMTTAIVPIAVLNNVLNQRSIHEIEVSMIMLVLGLLLSIMLLPAWGTALFSFVNLAMIIMLPLFLPDLQIGFSDLTRPFSINLIAAFLAIMGLYNRNWIENQRQEKLTQIAENLRKEINERQCAEERLRKRAAWLELITEFSSTTTAIMDIDELLAKAVELINNKFGYTNVNILLVEGDFCTLRAASLPEAKSRIGEIMLKVGEEGIIGWVAGYGEAALVPDVEKDPRFNVQIPEMRVRSELSVPIVFKNFTIGVLDAQSTELNFFTTSDQQTIQTIADQLAVSIENARLFDAEHAAREQAEALREAAQVIGSTLSLDEVIDAVLEQLARVLPYDSACVIMVEENQARVQAGRGYEKYTDEKTLSSTVFSLDSAIVKHVVGKGQAILIPEVKEFPGWVNTPFSKHIRSYLGVPLKVRDTVIGFFSLDREDPESFSERELEIGQIFASQASAAIENVRLFQVEERRATELEILRQVSLGLTATLEPESVFDAILNGVFELIPDVQDAHIFTTDGSKLSFRAALWHGGRRGELISEPRENGLTYSTLRSGETVVVNDLAKHPLFAEAAEVKNWSGSIVGIPVKIGDRVVGVLNIAHQKTNAFSDMDLRLLRLLADQAALAIENARLFNQTILERRHISLLFDVAQSLAKTLDPDEIQERALELTCQALGGNIGSIWAVDMEEDSLILKALFMRKLLPVDDWHTDMEGRIDIEETLIGWITKQNQAVNVPDVTVDERWTETPYVDEEIHSLIAAPISDGENLLGEMVVLHNQIGAFSDGHLDLLQSICHQVGLALGNARRYQDINRLVDLLAAEQNRLENLLETLPVGVLLLNKNQELLVANPLGRELLSILSPNLQGNKVTNLNELPLSDFLESSDTNIPAEITIEEPQRLFFEAQANPIGGEEVQWVLTLRETTLERETQERFQMQDRLATVGQLAAGIAHDFNNIMAAIVVYTDLLMMEDTLSDASQERLNIIQKQVERASSLIRQILDFSRRSVIEQSTLNLLPFMKEMQKLLERTLPETIKLELIFNEDDYLVMADPTRLQQVFMNLAVNARDAMESGGHLRFNLAIVKTDPDDPPIVMDMPLGEWVRISVKDTGGGIPPGDLSKVFEPFYTTKPVGQGTGLGLAQVYGIVRQHDGYIDVKSQLGYGTQFDIYLPALILPPDEKDTVDIGRAIDGTGKTVLLVEDDPTTRSALQAMLVTQNFKVLLASNGTEALAILNKENKGVVLVISDIVMPEMGGMDLYTIMQIRWPEIEILFITGHPLESQDQGFLERGNVGWLQKPFSITEFNQAVKNLVEK